MLKIYLDWNIISYLKKKKYIDLRNYIAEVKEFFVFPYSRGHLQDLYQSKSPTNVVKFEQDIETLTEICQTHLLEYNDSTDASYPYEVHLRPVRTTNIGPEMRELMDALSHYIIPRSRYRAVVRTKYHTPYYSSNRYCYM